MTIQKHERTSTTFDPGKIKILVVDDEPSIRDVLSLTLGDQEGYHVETIPDGIQALDKIRHDFFHIVFVDLRMPGADGIEVIKELKRVSPETEAVIITAYGTISTATQALRAGAYDYITKPFHIDEIKLLIEKIIELKQLQAENITLRKRIEEFYGFSNIIGNAPCMQAIFHIIRSVAESDTTVLILGESGTGKELIARSIHSLSNRVNKPWIVVNCAAIPEDLLESELFGYVKGAFTGAASNRTGRFESAHGGTIFLDEIGDMSPRLQAKILRIIEEREFEPLGSAKTIKVDVRIIAATNKNLEHAVESGEFRQDLYYRLHVVPVTLPPLRERLDDIPHLIRHFVNVFNIRNNASVEGFSPDAIELLKQNTWPGNVRELENIVEQMIVIYQKGTIEVENLPVSYRRSQQHQKQQSVSLWEGEKTDLSTVVSTIEKDLIREALQRADGVKSKAAELLNIKRTTLLEKMRKYNLDREKSSDLKKIV